MAKLAQLQDRQEVDDDLDAGDELGGQLAERESAHGRKTLGEPRDCLGDRDGVDGHVVEANDRHRLLFDTAQVGEGKLGGRYTRQQIGGLDDEAIVDAAQSRVGATRALKERDEGVRQRRIRAQLQQSREQDVALFPPDELLIYFTAVATGKEPMALHFQENGCDQEKLREAVHIELDWTDREG